MVDELVTLSTAVRASIAVLSQEEERGRSFVGKKTVSTSAAKEVS
jgi:hypothetical protein